MSLYTTHILPRFLDRSMRPKEFNSTRASVAGQAHGIVLEIGFGSGYNLPFYKDVTKLYALEPSQELYDIGKERVSQALFPIEYLQTSAENIPLADKTVDTVVSTWVLCSIPDIAKALKEVARVLKPGGEFIFVEHGLSSKPFFARVQRLVTPVTKRFTGNCHLDREIDALITEAGFEFKDLKKTPESGRPLMFSYRGTAFMP